MSPRHSRELSAAAAGAAADSRLSALTRTTTRLVTDKPSSVTAYKESWKEWKGGRWGGGGRICRIVAKRIFGIFRLRTRPEKLTSGMSYRLTYGMANWLTIGMANRFTIGMANRLTLGMANRVSLGMGNRLTLGMDYMLTLGMANRLTIGMANRLTTGMDYMYVIWCDAVAGESSEEKRSPNKIIIIIIDYYGAPTRKSPGRFTKAYTSVRARARACVCARARARVCIIHLIYISVKIQRRLRVKSTQKGD